MDRKEIGIIGLGKMGSGVVNRLLKKKISVAGYDKKSEKHNNLFHKNFSLCPSVKNLISNLKSPKTVWLMLPEGESTENIVIELEGLLSKDDILIDAGNSNYKDSQRRSKFVFKNGIHFLDIGTSGGIYGELEGYCLMIGSNSKDIVNYLSPLFNKLAFNENKGWQHLGLVGSGHFAKMIHNGIEYGIMQSIVEGLELINSKKKFDIDIKDLLNLWKNGSIVRSFLLDMLQLKLKENINFNDLRPEVPDSGLGRFMINESVEQGIPTPAIFSAVQMRFQSQNSFDNGFKTLSLMRNSFGGHSILKKK